MFEFIKRNDFDYYYIDVDPGAVDASRSMGVTYGFDANKFTRGFNDKIKYPNNYFDAIFSSHCVEHSFSLRDTFLEFNRILRPSGNIVLGVPLGWDENPEHPYFFDVDHWQAMIINPAFK